MFDYTQSRLSPDLEISVTRRCRSCVLNSNEVMENGTEWLEFMTRHCGDRRVRFRIRCRTCKKVESVIDEWGSYYQMDAPPSKEQQEVKLCTPCLDPEGRKR